MDTLAAIVACSVVGMAGIAEIYILFMPIPDRNETLIGQMLGSLWTALGLVVGFFFGSTRSSSKKDDTIAQLTKTKTEGP